MCIQVCFTNQINVSLDKKTELNLRPHRVNEAEFMHSWKLKKDRMMRLRNGPAVHQHTTPTNQSDTPAHVLLTL